MRTLCTVLTLAAALAFAPRLSAEEKARGLRGGEGEGLAAGIRDLHLTDEQEAKIADIRKEYRPKVENAAKEMTDLVKEEVEKIRAVLTPEQKEKLQTLREERMERRAEGLAERIAHLQELDLTDGEMAKIAVIRKECRPKIVKTMEGLQGILTPEQRKAREEALKAGKKRREVLASLNLTDDQKQKVKAVGEEVCTIVREEMEKIRDVLTEEQKEKLQEFREERREHVRDRMAHRITNLRDLNLTGEQKSQIAEIRKDYRPKIHEAGNKLRATVREEMEKIVAVLKG